MEFITNILFLSVSFFVFFAYRQGISDSFYIKNNIPLKREKEEKEFIDDYSKMMNYSFEEAGNSNGDK